MSKIVNFSNRKESNVKHELTQQAADTILGAKAHFSQVVLRRRYSELPVKVPFFAYTVEKDGLVYILQAEKGTSNTVFVCNSGHVRSISDGKTKIRKMFGNK